MSAVYVISILIPQVNFSSSQPQRDFQFQSSHFAIYDILTIEGFIEVTVKKEFAKFT
jgi:hypothetical protein